jgi:hypothetical protein
MAKKAAANKKSPKPGPAAKKAGGAKKKAAATKAPKPTPITEAELAQVYAKAWVDEAFRTLLETDPTAALKQYAAEHGLEWTKLVQVPAPSQGGEGQDENCIHLVSCC